MPIDIVSMPPSTLDLIEIIAAIISGSITALLVLLLTNLRENIRETKHYQNMLVLIILELYQNFKLLTELSPQRKPDYLFNNWDEFKIEVAKKLPVQTIIDTESSYNNLRPISGVTLSFVQKRCELYNTSFDLFIIGIKNSILELKKLVHHKDSVLDYIYSEIEKYNPNQRY